MLGAQDLRVNHSCCGTLEGFTIVQIGSGSGTGLQEESVHNGCLITDWGALCNIRPAFSTCWDPQLCWHIIYLEMIAVHLVLKAILPDLRDHHLFVWFDNMTVAAYINHQGGLRLHPLNRLVRLPLLWA